MRQTRRLPAKRTKQSCLQSARGGMPGPFSKAGMSVVRVLLVLLACACGNRVAPEVGCFAQRMPVIFRRAKNDQSSLPASLRGNRRDRRARVEVRIGLKASETRGSAFGQTFGSW